MDALHPGVCQHGISRLFAGCVSAGRAGLVVATYSVSAWRLRPMWWSLPRLRDASHRSGTGRDADRLRAVRHLVPNGYARLALDFTGLSRAIFMGSVTMSRFSYRAACNA